MAQGCSYLASQVFGRFAPQFGYQGVVETEHVAELLRSEPHW